MNYLLGRAVKARTRVARTIGLALAATTLSIAALAAPALGADRAPYDYVALGDSFTAGSGVLPIETTDIPLGCFQSKLNYPHLVQMYAKYGGFADRSCGGAQTEDMTQPQGVTPGPNSPQFDALSTNTRFVTLGIGGNDIGFGSIATSCLSISPWGSPCKNKYVKNGVDTLKQRIDASLPDVEEVINGIHDLAPNAKVFVVGYPKIVPRKPVGCWPKLPIAWGDAPYLDDVERNLNGMLKQAAVNAGAVYVDTYWASYYQDACKPPLIRWVEPLIPVGSFVPVHPNNIGEAGMAAEVRRVFDQQGL
jgi:hypothetical protein